MKKSPYDKNKLLSVIQSASKHLNYGIKLKVPAVKSSIRRIVIAGMGGSAISGMVIRDILTDYSDVPIFVFSRESIPFELSSDDLFIPISYSGKTGETLSMIDSCNAPTQIGISSVENFVKRTVTVPSGLPPRYAFYYIFSSLVKLISVNLCLPNLMEDLAGAASALELLSKSLIEPGGAAETGAAAMLSNIALIYSPAALRGASYRWKTQINENAKHHAFCHYFPEMCHNEIVPFVNGKKGMCVVLLRSAYEESIEKAELDHFSGQADLKFEFSSKNALDETLKFILLGDLISYELSHLNGEDPYEISMINELKDALNKGV